MCSYLQERSQEHIGSNYTGQGRGGLREARNWLLSGCAAVCICMPHPCAAPHVLPAGHRTTSSGNGWLQPAPWPIGTWMGWATTTLGLHQWAKKKKKKKKGTFWLHSIRPLVWSTAGQGAARCLWLAEGCSTIWIAHMVAIQRPPPEHTLHVH